MKRWIGLLVVVNVVLLLTGLSMEAVRGQPATLVDFNADKVRLLGRVERTAVAPVAAEPTIPAQAAEPTVPSSDKTEEKPAEPAIRCLVWNKLDEALLSEIETRLKEAGVADASYVIRLDKRLGWWVYLPPFANAEAMQDAIESARRKGIRDLAPVRGGQLENAVSLGAFPSLALARAQMEKVHSLGLEDARMGPRPRSGNARMVIEESVPAVKLAGLVEGWRKGRVPTACTEN